MTAPANPYLTLVIAARNDSYAGGMLRRLQVCIDSFVHQVEATALPSELMLVDWNPPSDRPLKSALTWPSATRWCTIRLITVPPALHAKQRFGDRLPILIHRARNVGVRRGHGAFILPTSADILFSDELVATFAMRRLDPAAMYRIVRHDVPEAVLTLDSHEERIRYCREHVIQVHGDERSYRIPGAPPLFTNAAGDFTLMSREMYARLRGIPEEHEFHSVHLDSVFCYQAHAAGATQQIFAEPCRMYHVDHGVPSWRRRPGLLERLAGRLPLKPKTSKRLVKKIRKLSPPRSPIARLGVPYLTKSTPEGKAQYEGLIRRILGASGEFFYNAVDWGLGHDALDEEVIVAAR
jgi:hypothetical protein